MEADNSYSSFPEPIGHSDDNSHGWQKVTAKKQRKNQNKKATTADPTRVPNGSAIAPEKSSVFKGLEKHAEERRRKLEAQRAAAAYDDEDGERPSRNHRGRDEEEGDLSSDADVKSNSAAVSKKEKQKKAKKPKVTLSEAAAKIDADDLVAFLSSVSESYEGQQDIQLMRFADYFGRAFSAVSAAQFPWHKLFRESAVAKIADVPVSYISEAVYNTSVDWINQRSYEALGSFVIWSLDSIMTDLAAQSSGSKGTKKGVQPASSKSQVAIFLVLAMVLRRKPDVLISLLPKLSENSKYQGQDKLPVFIWMVVQACQTDLAVGLYLWAHLILPILGGKSGSNPHTRDLVLQLVERVLSAPKARSILINNAVRKGERLIPPSALDLLLRVTFPAPSARVKATERFEAIFPVLKDVALAGSRRSKAMKQVSLQIQSLTMKSAGEGIPALSGEASSILIWCLIQNPDCYKQWEKIYVDNIEASVATLKKLAESWKEFSSKQSSLESLQTLKYTLKIFMQKNEKVLSSGGDATRQALFKEADKYCKTIMGKVSSGHGCIKAVFFTLAVVAVGAAVVFPNLEEWDLEKYIQ